MDTMTIKLSLDGDQWCALYGESLVEGQAGFGNTPIEAIQELLEEIQIYGPFSSDNGLVQLS